MCMQGLQDAFHRQQVAIAEALPPTITHMKSGAQVFASLQAVSTSPAAVQSLRSAQG